MGGARGGVQRTEGFYPEGRKFLLTGKLGGLNKQGTRAPKTRPHCPTRTSFRVKGPQAWGTARDADVLLERASCVWRRPPGVDVPEGAGTEGRLDTGLRLTPAGQQRWGPRDVAA